MDIAKIEVVKNRDRYWLAQKCRDYVDQYKLISFLCDVAVGNFYTEEIFETRGGRFETRPVYPEVRDRLRAVEILLDRGYGKSVQEIDVQTESDDDKIERKKRVLQMLENIGTNK